MRCWRIPVEGEAEVLIPVSPRDAIKPRQSHGKKSSWNNPYSSIGLDKFAGLNAELSAKREYVAKKTGKSQAQVRFAYSSKGWIPVVVNSNNNGEEAAPGVSILPPIRTREKEDSNNEVKGEIGSKNDVKGRGSQAVVPWAGYLMTTAFGFLTVIAILMRKSAVPAAAMVVVMVVCALQRRWHGGVMCMKRFVNTAISDFSQLFFYSKKIPETQSVQQPLAASPHQENANRQKGMTCLRAPTNPVKSQPQQPTVFSSSQQDSKYNKMKKYGRIVSMDSQLRKPMRLLQQSESFQSRRSGGGTIDCTVGAIMMVIILFFLVFYGILCAICFTCAWCYVLPKLRTDVSNTRSMMDVHSREYRKKVIMAGLLDRRTSHNNP